MSVRGRESREKSHAILVNPPFMLADGTTVRNINQRDFPLGLGLLATVLLENGYTAEIVNANIHADWEDRVLRSLSGNNVGFVGFSCMSSQIYAGIKLSKSIRNRFPDTPVVFGGVHPTLMPESLVRTPWVDFCIVGEGDAAVVPLMKFLNGEIDLLNVPNLVAMRGDEVIRTSIAPLSSFTDMPQAISESLYKADIEKYLLHMSSDGKTYKGFSVLTGLGCHYRCAFCINHITKRKYRARPAALIYKEMKYLIENYDIGFFNFQEEHFFGDKERFFSLLKLIEDDKDLFGKIKWNTTIRVSDIREDFINVDVLKRIKASGGDGFGVGGESGSDRVLRILRKGISRKDITRAVAFCNEAEFTLSFSFVMLWPGEEMKDMFDTARLIHEIYEAGPYANVPFFQTYRPYPGSLWETDMSRFSDPEQIPDDVWRFQFVDMKRVNSFSNADVLYKLIGTTQILCLMGMIRNQKDSGKSVFRRTRNIVSNGIAKFLYKICWWRIKFAYFGAYVEGPLYSWIRKRYFPY